jgi:uncharacterized membrane protein HdeD (DUF308 family)/uncharacterized membrane protein
MLKVKEISDCNRGYMFTQLSRNWWWLALRGIAAILFGIIALAWHGTTLRSFMLLFGSLALVDGLVAIFAALTNVTGKKRWWILLHGLVSIDIAVFTFIWTEFAATILLFLVSAWALITGILELVGAWDLRRNVSNERLLSLSGMASIIFAVLVIRFPKTGQLSLAAMIAAFAILFGLLMLALSLNIRSLRKYTYAVHRPFTESSMSHNGSLLSHNQSGSFEQGEQKTEKMLMAVFNTTPQALKGVYDLKDLHRVGDITLYTTAVIVKEPSGKVSIKQASERELNATPLGLLTGIVLGTFGGPLGTAIGGLIGGLVGLIFDLAKTGISADFLEDTSQFMDSGEAALLAEIAETSVAPLDARLAKLGGHVYRWQRFEFVEDQMMDELDTINADLHQP